MKNTLLAILVFSSVLLKAQELTSPKPGISIYGSPCLIGNLVYSCTPKTCDSIMIIAGDSIDFCTLQEIYLNADTAYWMRWHFNGCTNLPDTLLDVYPSQTPICYWPQWDTAGTFSIEVLYNGWLSAYPSSDCYSFGPSRWLINVVVLPNPNAVQETEERNSPSISPNPSDGFFRVEMGDLTSFQRISITDVTGREILSTTDTQFDLSEHAKGIYFAQIICDDGMFSQPVIIR